MTSHQNSFCNIQDNHKKPCIVDNQEKEVVVKHGERTSFEEKLYFFHKYVIANECLVSSFKKTKQTNKKRK